MSGSLGKSKNENESSFNQDVWGGQGDALTDLYGRAGDMFGQVSGGLPGQAEFGQQSQMNTMNTLQNPWEQQLAGGAYQDMGLQDSLMSSLSQSQNTPSAMQDINSMIMGGSGNNYADAMKSGYIEDANRASQNMLGNLDARAAASGMSGGSRQGVATAQGFDDINRNLQNNMAMTGFNTFDKDLDRKLGIAQQADMNTFGRQQLMSDMIGDQQNTMNQGMGFGNNMMGYGNQQQMSPWQQLGGLSGIIGGPEVLSSGSGSGSGKSLQSSGGYTPAGA